MLRIGLGVIAGFLSWVIVWFASEKILSAILPEAFGAPQRAFQDAVTTHPAQFTADNGLLLMHIVLVLIVSAISGYLAALIAGENQYAPLILGVLLLATGILKAVMSWTYVPIWYHIVFTALLIVMAIVGGKLRTTS